MNLLESLRVAMRGLASNKMRTMLTMLGIIIGVAVVILVVAIGQGATQRVTETINQLGTNQLSIWPGQSHIRINAVTKSSGATATGSTSGGGGGGSTLTLLDANLIAKNFPEAVAAVAPQVRGNAQVRLENKDANTNITGSTVEYLQVSNADVDSGRFFTENEQEGSQKVCVVGHSVSEKLLGDASIDLTGKDILLNRIGFHVIGMLKPKGSGAWGQDQDDVIIIPITTAMNRVLNRRFLNFVAISATSQKMMPLAQEQISAFLRNRHHLQPPFPDNDDFNIRSQTELMESQQSVTGTMTTLLKRGCCHFACRRRHRHYEHHARVGHGANPRNRNSQSHWSHAPRHFHAVYHRSDDYFPAWRAAWHLPGRGRRSHLIAHRGLEYGCELHRCSRGSCRLGWYRYLLRHLPGQQSRRPAPDRSIAL